MTKEDYIRDMLEGSTSESRIKDTITKINNVIDKVNDDNKHLGYQIQFDNDRKFFISSPNKNIANISLSSLQLRQTKFDLMSVIDKHIYDTGDNFGVFDKFKKEYNEIRLKAFFDSVSKKVDTQISNDLTTKKTNKI